MINEEEIKKMVREEFEKNVLSINEFESYKMTSQIPQQGIRSLTVFNQMILYWIDQVVNSDKDIATPETKVQIIKEILSCMNDF